jgi:hypothetical protein
MNFTFTWIMDKLGYMPKIDMEIGKVAQPWSFPVTETKKKPTVQKATTRIKKPAVKKPKAKKA